MSDLPVRIEDMFDDSASACRPPGRQRGGYADPVARMAREIAAEIRRRSPGIGVKKLHKLLYYCQGHHLSGLGRPLFSESVSAWDMGPVVGQLWYAEKEAPSPGGPSRLDEAELNTIGYVLSRYGRLTARDLEHMTHGEQPWIKANAERSPGRSARIRPEWMREYFEAEQDPDEDGPVPDSEAIRGFVRGAAARREQPVAADSVAAIRSRMTRNG